MINLLPPELKKSYRYAHRNVTLRRWAVAFLVALVGLGALATYGLLDLHQSIAYYNRQINDTQAILERDHLAQTEQQVQDISNRLRLADKVLSQEVLFSKLIQQIGAAMPAGAILSSLNINDTSGGLDLMANATDYTAATQVQVNMADPANKIFAKADIVSISCGKAQKNSAYPCTVTLRALFSSNNPFLFINQKAKS